ncbi:MAG: class I SAM-dependent methyltransferase [Nitrospirae bacterium]|nr:class I SAM-dependent methyltransferase [Nitrospirota bacterium]
MPSEQELRRWYQEQYWTLYQTEQLGPGRGNVFAHALEWLHHLTPHPGTLVDVGCGAGQLLALCRERLWRGIGFDPSSAAVARAQRLGLEVYAQLWPPCPLDDETADAVTFINVLDHLHDPFQALQEAWRILKPGGLLYIRVPNGPVHVRLMRLLSAARLDHLTVFHLYGFGRGAFLYHLPRLGFTVVAVQTAPPTQGDAYKDTARWTTVLKRFLKVADRLAYRVLASLGLDRRAWGLSIEVMARKVHLA